MKSLKYTVMVMLALGVMQVKAQDGSVKKVKTKRAVRKTNVEKTAPVVPAEIDREKKAPEVDQKTDNKGDAKTENRMKTSKKIKKTAPVGK